MYILGPRFGNSITDANTKMTSINQAEKINKANEAKLHAADEKKAKCLADVKEKV